MATAGTELGTPVLTGAHSSRPGRPAVPGVALLAGAALVLTAVSWPLTNLAPQAGLDNSWRAGLAMASVQPVPWGPHLVFTYGPLGFLGVPALYYTKTAVLSFLFLLGTRWALFALLLALTWARLPRWAGLVVSYAVGLSVIALSDPSDVLMGLNLLGCMTAMGRARGRSVDWPAAVLGSLAGAELLLKYSVGLQGVALVGLFVLSRSSWWRDMAAALTSAAASVVVCWVLTGNAIGNLPEYFRMTTSVAAGYAGAMSYESDTLHQWAEAIFVLACLLFGVWAATRASPARQRAATVLMFLAFGWFVLKEGFVRHDTLHAAEFFSLSALAFVALPWRLTAPRHGRHRRPHRMAALGLSGAAAGAALVLALGFAWKMAAPVLPDPLDVPHNLTSLASNLRTLVSSERRQAVMGQARARLLRTYGVPLAWQRRLRGTTVAVEPYENTLAWALPDVRWDPEPVLQQYSAYENSLDDLDASFLASAGAPRFVLLQPSSVYIRFFRDPFFGAPAATISLLCHYTPAARTASWALLQRVPDRCGGTSLVGRATARLGQTVTVPRAPAGDAVVATFSGIGSSPVYALENLVIKAPEITMGTNRASYRFIAGTQNALHLMRLPVGAGYGPRFSPPQLSDFRIQGGAPLSGTGRYRVWFYVLPIK